LTHATTFPILEHLFAQSCGTALAGIVTQERNDFGKISQRRPRPTVFPIQNGITFDPEPFGNFPLKET
jgi:hypothetical protein